MMEILFHMSFALFILAGVVYFSIFSWFKMQQTHEEIDDQSEALNLRLNTDLTSPFSVHTHDRIYF